MNNYKMEEGDLVDKSTNQEDVTCVSADQEQSDNLQDESLFEIHVDDIINTTLSKPAKPKLTDITMDVDLEVIITVKKPKMSETLFKYIRYTVQGEDASGQFLAERRYKEFLSLRTRLGKAWPGCVIPTLPPKKSVGNKGFNFVLKRQKQLNDFISKVVRTSHFHGSDEVQTFLRGPSDFHKLGYEKITTDDIFEKFRTYYFNFA